jgi:hypothetical protein
MNKDETLTLAEVAAAVADDQSAEARELCIRRIRHWGSHGVLETAGEAFTGTGRYRRFSPEEAYIAKVLTKLARFGLTLGQLKKAVRAIALARSHSVTADFWEEAKTSTGSRVIARFAVNIEGQLPFLSFSMRREEQGLPLIEPPTLQEDVVIAFDLTRAFSEIRL